MRRILVGLLAGLFVAAAVFAVPTIWLKPWSIDHFYARVFVRFALRHPELLTQLGLFEGTPFDGHSARLDDYSLAFQEEEERFTARQLAILRSYDRARMTPEQLLSCRVLEWFLADAVDGQRFRFHDYPVNQLFGVQSSLPDFMINQHPLKRPRDAEHYLKRIDEFSRVIDQVIVGLRERERRGVVPPRFVLARVLAEMRAFVERPVTENPLHVNFVTKCGAIAKLPPERRARLEERLTRSIEASVLPAYRRLIACCAHLDSVATDDDGVWKLPEGAAWYAYRLRNATTTDLGADSLHALGLREIARLQVEMKTILAAQGYPTEDLAATMNRLDAESRFHYAPGDSARTRILADYQSIIDDADRRVAALFHARPKAGVRVERVPEFKEATAPGGYYNSASLGGDRPGTFFANLRDPQETVTFGMRTLAYHEAIPGHHYQVAVAQELKGLPFFRTIIPFTAYGEGWALYAEHLALENGFHPTAFDSLGALQAELFRAVRLVVDTGLHHYRWTRAQAIDYMVTNTGLPTSEVITEVERYIVMPGQACAYKVGELQILALRDQARTRLGLRFDIRKFHDVILTNGALPLKLLEDVVNAWIAAELRTDPTGARG